MGGHVWGGSVRPKRGIEPIAELAVTKSPIAQLVQTTSPIAKSDTILANWTTTINRPNAP
eukprot:scaffold16881_cov137-Skeletonema_menzelii.AAC.1